MAPIEHEEREYSNSQPIAILFLTTAFLSVLLANVFSTLRFAARSIPPAHDTRLRASRRMRHIRAFAILATLGFLVTLYHQFITFAQSYQAWAIQRGEDVPEGLDWVRASRWLTADEGLKIGNWWNNTHFWRDNYETMFKRSGRFWWSQQYFLGSILWSVFVSIEGRRRAIPIKTILAVIVLGQSLGLSFAQNLFNILIVLTPTPLPRTEKRPNQHAESSWVLVPAAYIVPALASLACVACAPYLQDSGNLCLVLTFARYPLLLLIGAMAKIAPTSWYEKCKSAHVARRSYTTVFHIISAFAFALHIKQTITALFDNTPNSHYQKHMFVWNMHSTERRSIIDKTRIAIGHVLASLSDHPSVSLLGWDVLLSAAGLFTLAFVRGLDARDMLAASGFPEAGYRNIHSLRTKQANEDNTHTPFTKAPDDAEENSSDSTIIIPRQKPLQKRTRARSRKNEITNIANSTSTSMRRNARNYQTQQQKLQQEYDNEDLDSPYIPPATTRAEVAEMQTLNDTNDDDLIEDAEAGALAWGLFVAGGLGVATAGVLGGLILSL